MAGTSLEHVLHYRCPEWSESIQGTRKANGFSFDMQPEVQWKWLVAGGHERLKNLARVEVQRLGVPEFYDYYLSCVYSNFERPGGTIDFEAIKGPPWFNLPCPAEQYGPKWRESVESARLGLYCKFSADPSTIPGPLVAWLWHAGVEELFDVAVRKVAKLALEPWAAVLWVCCILPPGTKYMVPHSKVLYERFPDLIDWENLGLMCGGCPARLRCRAYPSHIDWNRGTPAPDGLPAVRLLLTCPGVRCLRGTLGHATTWWRRSYVKGAHS